MSYFGGYFGGGGGGPGDDSVETISVDGIGRLDPVRVVLDMPSNLDLFVIYKSGPNYQFLIYGPSDESEDEFEFSGTFRDQSTIEVDGTTRVLDILPNGGWWTSNFKLMFISGSQLGE